MRVNAEVRIVLHECLLLRGRLTKYLSIEYAYALIKSLRTSSIATIVDRLNPLLHIDPVSYFPPEITFQIFSYLDPASLLKASSLSKAWREPALDSRLWRKQFCAEGWVSKTHDLRSWEEAERNRLARISDQRTRVRRRPEYEARQAIRKRARAASAIHEENINADSSQYNNHLTHIDRNWSGQNEDAEPDGVFLDADEDDREYDKMEDINFHVNRRAGNSAALFQKYESLSELVPNMKRSADSVLISLDPPLRPQLAKFSAGTIPKVNWLYLYKQKRRLEENWNAGRYVNAQLPHPKYRFEAHDECVYTIQYSASFLVSGSRDKTIRIWDLSTQRLVRSPLVGHTASVLCLQFDESVNEDVIISGGSDCHVMIWRFSTGELIGKLTKAHTESVLNLRFDKLYLVTCSKDKTIKVWNRRNLAPGDDAYPLRTGSNARFPAYIIDVTQQHERQHLQFKKPLMPYGLLMTLSGHSAAVNAIQICDGQIVSASGDRLIKVWDVRTGACLNTLQGHTKGIACVQYDGTRIVSGSSDTTVRIFDRSSGAEVACLQGHSNLVRTVQASFGDLPPAPLNGNNSGYIAEVQAVNKEFMEAKLKGIAPRPGLAYGAKLPPGGGGGRWGRIVSGSYDETVIIWKRNLKGSWIPAQRLRQADAIRALGRRSSRRGYSGNSSGTTNISTINPTAVSATISYTNGTDTSNSNLSNQVSPPVVPAEGTLGTTTGTATLLASPVRSPGPSESVAEPLSCPGTLDQLSTSVPDLSGVSNHKVLNDSQANRSSPLSQDAIPRNYVNHMASSSSDKGHDQKEGSSQQARHDTSTILPTLGSELSGGNPSSHTFAALSLPATQVQDTQDRGQQQQHQHQTQQQPAQQQQSQPLPPLQQPQSQQSQQPQQPLQQQQQQRQLQQQGANARVFKLQFDARRIVCCSQDPTIVIWDFANNDAEIIEASQFFGDGS